MANVSTMDTEAATAQAARMIEAGAAYVRFTAQGEREAHQLGVIRKALNEQGYTTPIVADIHFNPRAATAAAQEVEKVRINPGNYAPTPEAIRERFVPLLTLCKQHGTAIRIGVNHGSLSPRIMAQYGDTPEGMVASCLEFLHICREKHFTDVVISIKASNTVVMVKTVRLLVEVMDAQDMHYPLHLGVTEAGDGEDGRIKSAVGIGALLSDGIGDTIRVSLSEPPEAEIPVAQKLLNYITNRKADAPLIAPLFKRYNPLSITKRPTRQIANIGGLNVPIVLSTHKNEEKTTNTPLPDYLYIANEDPNNFPDTIPLITDSLSWKPKTNVYPLFTASQIDELTKYDTPLKFIHLTYADLNDHVIEVLSQDKTTVIILSAPNPNSIGTMRATFHKLMTAGCDVPVILHREYAEADVESLQLKASVDLGTLLLDGFGDGVMLHNTSGPAATSTSTMFGILQATRTRISKTEYISCPGCGRTLYDLQTTIARIKAATSHLKGLKIAIMGCIVNGPGEMADADYGYVGSTRTNIDLYKGKTCIHKNIPESEAVRQLIQLIKENGDWKDPTP
jgi:(E)-4-hydroxy-3-methylbut-2-enyl-diphosphate synthase